MTIPKVLQDRPQGVLFGPGTPTSDEIPARISHQEYILNAEALPNQSKLSCLTD